MTFMMNSNRISSLYVLKHKDLDVAMVQIDTNSGVIEYVLEVYLSQELPIGCKCDLDLMVWWKARAIPDSRKGIQRVLRILGEGTSQSLMLATYGLSLTDHYWVQPIGEELYWKDINFYENSFSDELGNLLTDSDKIDIGSNISKFSPSSSVNGEMKKKWVIMDGIRYLLKISANNYGQQAVNELIASRLHTRLNWKNYVPYSLEKTVIDGKEYPCSINPLFTSMEEEFVSAYQLVRNYKIPNESSSFEAIISQAAAFGIDENAVREQLEYTILTDFILTNTDRHFNNFGFLYNPAERKITAMAPVFDTGNALFYSDDIVPSGKNLLDIRVNSFCKRETDMLRYVKNRELINTALLKDFPEEVKTLLDEYTEMPEERAEQISNTVREKLKYLELFMQGKKIWKREKFW